MNALGHVLGMHAPTLYGLGLAALHGKDCGSDAPAEARWLQAQRRIGSPERAMAVWLAAPPDTDRLLHALAQAMSLQAIELIAVAIAAAIETDSMVGRVVAWLQAPLGDSRPTVGLVLGIARVLGIDASLHALLEGPAREGGLLSLDCDLETTRRPLSEQALHVPLPVVMALLDGFSAWPGVKLMRANPDGMTPSLRAAAGRQAQALRSGACRTLAIRSGHVLEARAAATLVAHELGMRAAFFEQVPARGAGVWLSLVGAVPVVSAEPAPGEVHKLPRLPGHAGPLLVASSPEGAFERDGEAIASWRVPLPNAAERGALWTQFTGDAELASRIGRRYRHDGARITQLGQSARHHANLAAGQPISHRHIGLATRSGTGLQLGSLTELLSEDIDDDALIVPPALRDGLIALRCRCELREDLADGLGASTRTRYRPGVRALLVGPSGTGKTLAAGWLATQLGLPLYRVDVAAITSKYIGETEKNLSQLFARAEHAEVVLLFDEADSLFGKRTDVKESNDRFANAQTNYLLQRIESFEGIAILTSNSRSRFDSAFTRRLDAILDFPQPSAEERRALWSGHLGAMHTLSQAQLNRISGACDMAGGHIRNIVLAAAVRARRAQRPLAYEDVVHGIAAECRKLARQVPAGLDTAGEG